MKSMISGIEVELLDAYTLTQDGVSSPPAILPIAVTAGLEKYVFLHNPGFARREHDP